MQSINDIARAITELEPAERQTLMDRLVQLNAQADSNGQNQSRIQAIEDAMNDELFLADLREVMEDFSHVDAEKTLHDAGTLERLVGEPRSGCWFRTRQDAPGTGF